MPKQYFSKEIRKQKAQLVEAIRWLRGTGLTLNEIAAELGCDSSAVGQWYHGTHTPRVSRFYEPIHRFAVAKGYCGFQKNGTARPPPVAAAPTPSSSFSHLRALARPSVPAVPAVPEAPAVTPKPERIEIEDLSVMRDGALVAIFSNEADRDFFLAALRLVQMRCPSTT